LVLGYLALVYQILKIAVQSFIHHFASGLSKGIFQLLRVDSDACLLLIDLTNSVQQSAASLRLARRPVAIGFILRGLGKSDGGEASRKGKNGRDGNYPEQLEVLFHAFTSF
jgi:hypothetical protein